MATGFYLLDHQNRIQQYRTPRRATLSGMVGVHTTEGALDRIAPDTGAENVANFIVNRSDYGSYHVIVDTDSVVKMAPDEYETWHIGADAHNWHSWGISAACRATEWDPDAEWTKTIIAKMGAEISAFWRRQGFLALAQNPRWLSRDQALRHEAGLIHHGVAQPGDRSDAWKNHPDRARLDQMLLDAIKAATYGGGSTPPPPGGLSVSDANTILKAVSELSAKVDRVAADVAVWEQQTRGFEGLTPVKLAGDPAQYIVTYAPGVGWAKVHVPGPGKPVLKAQGTIQVNAAGFEGDYVTIKDPEQVAWLKGLPTL